MGGQNIAISVAAQIVNFLVLVALLKWVLYDRVLRVLKARQQKIADRFQQAQRAEQEAQALAQEYQRKIASFEEQQEQRLSQARDEVESFRRKLSTEARRQVAQQEMRWSEALQQQQASFARELSRQAATRICSVARQVLHDLASAQLEDQIASGLVHRLQQLDDSPRLQLASALTNPGGVVSVTSSFELSAPTRQALAASLRDLSGREVELEFQRDPQMTCGMVLQAGSYKIAWSIDQYVDELTRQVEQVLAEEAQVPNNAGGSDA